MNGTNTTLSNASEACATDQELIAYLLEVDAADFWQKFAEKLVALWSLDYCAVFRFLPAESSVLGYSATDGFQCRQPDYPSTLSEVIQSCVDRGDLTIHIAGAHCQVVAVDQYCTVALVLKDCDEIRLNNLMPYVVSAVQLEHRLQAAKNSSELDRMRIQAVFNQFRVPVASLDESGKLIVQNDKMRRLIESGVLNPESLMPANIPSLVHGTVKNFANNSALKKQTAVEHDLAAIHQFDMVLTDGSQAKMVLQQDEQGEWLLYLLSSKLLDAMSEDKLCDLFGLTQREARCAYLFVCGKSVTEIAESEGRSVHTVREQLRSCYNKTNSKTQLQFISLMASLPGC